MADPQLFVELFFTKIEREIVNGCGYLFSSSPAVKHLNVLSEVLDCSSQIHSSIEKNGLSVWVVS